MQSCENSLRYRMRHGALIELRLQSALGSMPKNQGLLGLSDVGVTSEE